MQEGAVIDASNAPGGPLVWVFDEPELAAMLEQVRTAVEVVMDLETTGLKEYAWTGGWQNEGVGARVSLAALTLPQPDAFGSWDGVEPTTWIVPLSHPNSPYRGTWRTVLQRIAETMVEAERPWVNANVKFDARWVCATAGVALEHLIVWDTQVSSHLLDETISTRLKDRVPHTFGIPPWDDHDLSYPGASEEVELFSLGEYAARDTYWTWRLACNHRYRMRVTPESQQEYPDGDEEMREAQLGVLATWVAMPMVASLTRIEQNGFRLDVPWTREHLAENEEILTRSLDEMSAAYDMDRAGASVSASSNWFKEWTHRAVENGDLVVQAMTETGAPSWGKGVLARQELQGRDMAALLRTARTTEKRAQYLRSWLAERSKDDYIHTTYWPGRVVTGRLSSEGPNMQQVTKPLRPAFIADDGWCNIDLDYSQIELRVAAFIARCLPMIQAFQDGKDLHRIIAAVIAKVTEDLVTADWRQKGKAINFGLIFGMQAFGLREYAETNYGVAMSAIEAQDAYFAFFDTWDGLAQWHARSVTGLHRNGFVTSPIGRIRRLPGVFSSNPKLVSFSERAGINSPVQGFASDLMQMSAASIQGLLPGTRAVPGARVVGTVHDSIIVQSRIEDRFEVAAACQERMTGITKHLDKFGVDFDVPLVADASIGSRWSLNDLAEAS